MGSVEASNATEAVATVEETSIETGERKACTCRTCTDIARWKAALDIRTPEGKEAFEEMLVEMEAIGTDLGWYQAVHEGKWPDSVQILERSLEHARKVQDEGATS